MSSITLKELLQLSEDWMEDPLEIALVNPNEGTISIYRPDSDSGMKVSYTSIKHPFKDHDIEVMWYENRWDEICKELGLDPDSTDWYISQSTLDALDTIIGWATNAYKDFKKYRKENKNE